MKMTQAVPLSSARSSGTCLEGVAWVDLDVHRDERGFFVELYNHQAFSSEGLDITFVQDNHSRSGPGVLRGLHFQRNPTQGKLITAVTGVIFDVVVDLRKGSSTYGRWYCQELGERVCPGRLLWVPRGFAHGFCVLGDSPADVVYKVDGLYDRESDSGIRFNDPDLRIPWPIVNPRVSKKDLELPGFRETDPLLPHS